MKAFPGDKFEIDAHGNKQPMGSHAGMDLRDYMAAGIAPMITKIWVEAWKKNKTYQDLCLLELGIIAEKSYEFADVLMEARKK